MTARPDDMTSDLHATIAALRRQLQERTAELAARNSAYGERIEHQSATIDVLREMAASPGDAQPVFDLIVRRAQELCNSTAAGLFEYDGELMHFRAVFGGNDPEEVARFSAAFPMAPTRAIIAGRAILDRQTIHIRDTTAETELHPVVQNLSARSIVAIPLLRAGVPVGAFSLNTKEPGGFSDSQVALLKTFAEQAVIAISSAETYRALQTRTADLQESLAYQTATSDVLKVISRSAFDLQPVLDTLVETAAGLCDAEQAVIFRREGELVRLVANFGFPPEYEAYTKALGAFPVDPTSPTVGQRALVECRTVHIHDAAAVPGYWDVSITMGGQRTSLGVPLMREGKSIGHIVLARQRVEPFSDRQIELVSTFADQAVIAIENTRLLTEQQEALERQTATAEVLQVINASPGDLAPVFDAILEKAHSLCGAAKGAFIGFDGEHFQVVATRGLSDAFTTILRNTDNKQAHAGYAVDELSPRQQLLNGASLVQIAGPAVPIGPIGRAVAELENIRTVLFVPLRRDGALLGYITAYREEEALFSDKQIALLQSFADQAVIAMENARLINEQREALEQQTATAEVLQVINASPGNLAPVFDAVLERALRLCGGSFGALLTYDGERIERVAFLGVPPGFIEYTQQNPLTKSAVLIAQGIATGKPVQATDVMTDTRMATSPSVRDALVELGGIRAILQVPLLKDGSVVGFIGVWRREPGVFPDRQIAVVEGFAAQAVIAMENARLINEQREALEQQTATTEVLQVINASPGELAPVFDTVLEKAIRLCESEFGLLNSYDGDCFHVVASRGIGDDLAEYLRAPIRSGPGLALYRMVQGENVVHIADITDDDAYRSGNPGRRAIADLGGARSQLMVALRKDRTLLGAINIFRQEVRTFSDKQIALVENFAAQAVIAMENARLINEQREALEQQTATAEVLQVINASPGDLAPVFDAMLEKAMRLCGAAFGSLYTYDGEHFQSAAQRGVPAAYAAHRATNPPEPQHGLPAQLLETKRFVHVVDMTNEDHYRAGEGDVRAMVALAGARTILSVPLLKDDAVRGFITIYRQEVRAFSDKQIALLENFAAQAVIAMENARLITEQREALEQQTATAEVLQVINASPGSLAPVFDAILEKAHSLCHIAAGSLELYDGERFRAVAVRGLSDAFADMLRHGSTASDNPATRPLIEGSRFSHIRDLSKTDYWLTQNAAELTGARTLLCVPLRREDALLGMIASVRREVRPFSEKEITLLENFAAQAVIAMENARLINEQREALEQQTATAEVLRVINASPGDLSPVFEVMLGKAMHLCEAAFGLLLISDGETADIVGSLNVPSAFTDYLVQEPPRLDEPTFLGRAFREQAVVHIADAAEGQPYRNRNSLAVAAVELGRIRSMLMVPLIAEGTTLGLFTIYRQEVRAFSNKQIALVENFAAQAVIAMENARLINEQREALDQQTATAEVLQVINASPGDLTSVFDTMLEKAMRLCGAALGSLQIYDGECFWPSGLWGIPGLAARPSEAIIPDPGSALQRMVDGNRVVHIPDVIDTDAYRQGVPSRLRLVATTGARTALWVALRKEETLLGVFVMYRREVRAFSDKQIALLENFAAQAVIAMENARLLHELRARTDELAQRQTELRVTFENMGDGVAMFDATPRLVAWNRKFQEIFDVPDALLHEHRTYADYIRYLAERGDYGPNFDLEQQVSRVAESGGEYQTYERTRPDGRVIEVRRNPVAAGGFVLIFADITERKRSEAELRTARDAAEDASRTIEAAYRDLKAAQASLIQAEKMASLGQLTAGIAHEIKNPLNFVNNFAILSVELLAELKEIIVKALASLDEDQRADAEESVGLLTSNLEKITEHGRRADGIVKSMLEHSRGASGERRMVDLNTLVDEALNLAYHGARAQDQSFNITLERDFGEDVAPIELAPQDVTRVFLNLFSNGFYAASERARSGTEPDFEPTLKVTTRELGDTVEIRVRDNGTGIPADMKDKLFQPFFTTKPTGEGTGLGLSISYDIVTQQHGGTITVDSEVGAYTEFMISLPRRAFGSEGPQASR